MEKKALRREKCWKVADLLMPWIPVMALFSLTTGLPFFWDTLQLASRHAHFFYEHHFGSFFLPNDMDSGHIPVFGMFLALMWELFGRSLAVSHLAMLPFVAGAVWATRKLVNHLFTTRYNGLITLFLLADATILAQFTLVSPDVWILCFFTMALYGFLREKRVLLAVASAALAFTSMRGMMIVAAFFTTGLVMAMFFSGEKGTGRKWPGRIMDYLLQAIPMYLPAALFAALYLGAHYLRTGWIGYHAGMPWADHFARVDFSGFIRNIFIFGWRLADHGRIFIWMAALFLGIQVFRKRLTINPEGRRLILLTLVLGFVFSYSALTYKNLAGHRYLIPLFFMIALVMLYHLIIFVKNQGKATFIISVLLAGLLSGNFWVYPDPIAKGWDASLAYLPYQQLRREMNRFIGEKGITPEETGTCFPNNIALKYIDLSDDERSFGTLENNPDEFRYILYSNVFNDFPEALPAKLEKEWITVKAIKRVQVTMILYQNPGWKAQGVP